MAYQKSNEFYFSDGDVAIRVGSVVYKLHSGKLCEESIFFAENFELDFSREEKDILPTPGDMGETAAVAAIRAEIADCRQIVLYDEPQDIEMLFALVYFRDDLFTGPWKSFGTLLAEDLIGLLQILQGGFLKADVWLREHQESAASTIFPTVIAPINDTTGLFRALNDAFCVTDKYEAFSPLIRMIDRHLAADCAHNPFWCLWLSDNVDGCLPKTRAESVLLLLTELRDGESSLASTLEAACYLGEENLTPVYPTMDGFLASHCNQNAFWCLWFAVNNDVEKFQDTCNEAAMHIINDLHFHGLKFRLMEHVARDMVAPYVNELCTKRLILIVSITKCWTLFSDWLVEQPHNPCQCVVGARQQVQLVGQNLQMTAGNRLIDMLDRVFPEAIVRCSDDNLCHCCLIVTRVRECFALDLWDAWNPIVRLATVVF
ncbi:hypothetical protein BC936DRAFT_139545 [Jimgerdemannia flammicorona]|uniref:Uncharacterized protein n=1 Tax=Jimgerdemannia flammicorona TaxID=994334 RepID=A0A433B9P6_9FUNG|nr:hypothetical protein BC936DRAFT_139545 [Jimgerdemannia flammicorona]